ncbi:scopoletin glucosyltransferase-like [Chenopodium quinoa]|uniref:scopoletin glucosyltransferase-like n=1 Tax=Chenopodium quinoa TaxID=63459 RepID=UPI000B791177|nr:scopoletin glucosyltransferase-like [Chenopodium quinoa]
MSSEQDQLHIVFLPFMAPGHMIPTMDMARLFATRKIKSTIVTTPANANYFAETIQIHSQKDGLEIDLLTIKFQYDDAGLPKGCENADSLTSPEMFSRFFKAIDLLQQPFADLLQKCQPNCLVADHFIHWANSVAIEFGIPCLTFHGSSYFSQCITYNLLQYEPHKNLLYDSDTFVVPGDLPHKIKFTKSELSPYDKKEGPNFLLELMDKVRDAVKACNGVIMNSYYELEPAYAGYYARVMGMKHWHIGPFSLYFNRGGDNEAFRRVKKSSVDVNECTRWLDEKEPDSVIYVCLGSMSNVSDAQLYEIAISLEALGQNFILVVRNEDTKEWVPQGFEARIEGRGLIIRGWAPQQIILDHRGVGGFVTHCGWNSILEGVVSGVPMVTWPFHAEQFYNEKLVTDVLKMGVPVGSKKWVPRVGSHNITIGNKEILNAMAKILIGEEAQDMKRRAKECKEMARLAISEGGSSYSHLSALIEELKAHKSRSMSLIK